MYKYIVYVDIQFYIVGNREERVTYFYGIQRKYEIIYHSIQTSNTQNNRNFHEVIPRFCLLILYCAITFHCR